MDQRRWLLLTALAVGVSVGATTVAVSTRSLHAYELRLVEGASFGNQLQGAIFEHSLVVESRSSEDLLLSVRSIGCEANTQPTALALPSYGRAVLSVKLDLRNMHGDLEIPVVCEVTSPSDEKRREFQFIVRGNVQRAFLARPSFVTLVTKASAGDQNLRFVVRATPPAAKPPTVSGVGVKGFTLREVGSGEWEIRACFSPQKTPGTHRNELRIGSKEPSGGAIHVPVTYTVPPRFRVNPPALVMSGGATARLTLLGPEASKMQLQRVPKVFSVSRVIERADQLTLDITWRGTPPKSSFSRETIRLSTPFLDQPWLEVPIVRITP